MRNKKVIVCACVDIILTGYFPPDCSPRTIPPGLFPPDNSPRTIPPGHFPHGHFPFRTFPPGTISVNTYALMTLNHHNEAYK